MMKKIKSVWEDVKDWLSDISPLERTNEEELKNAFFAGSGQAFWLWIIIIGVYEIFTKTKLDFVKR